MTRFIVTKNICVSEGDVPRADGTKVHYDNRALFCEVSDDSPNALRPISGREIRRIDVPADPNNIIDNGLGVNSWKDLVGCEVTFIGLNRKMSNGVYKESYKAAALRVVAKDAKF